MRLSDSILINCPYDSLYRFLSDMEHHVEVLPGYIESRIVERSARTCVVQREAIIRGTRRRWKSEVWFEEDRAIHFRQCEGLLKDMRVDWWFENDANRTRLEIVHELTVRPRWKGWWVERWIAKPAIEQTARAVLEAVKTAAEKRFTT